MEWKIEDLMIVPQEGSLVDVVRRVFWRVYMRRDGQVVTRHGVVKLPSPEYSFVPFQEITEPLVVNWVKNAIEKESPGAIERLKSSMEDALELLVNPPEQKRPLPWSR